MKSISKMSFTAIILLLALSAAIYAVLFFGELAFQNLHLKAKDVVSHNLLEIAHNIFKNYFILLVIAMLVFVLFNAMLFGRYLFKLWFLQNKLDRYAKNFFTFPVEIYGREDDFCKAYTKAFNKIISQLKQVYLESKDYNNHLHSFLFRDLVTGLGNKAFLQQKIAHMLSSNEIGSTGAFILLKIISLSEYREHFGGRDANLLLCVIAAFLNKLGKNFNVPIIARTSDDEFALVISGLSLVQLKELGNHIKTRLKSLADENTEIKQNILFNIGMVIYTNNSFVEDLYNKAVIALRNAINYGPDLIHLDSSLYEGKEELSLDWQAILLKALDDKNVLIHYQPVFFYEKDGTLLFHNECFMRILGAKKEVIRAGVFLPYINMFNMHDKFEKLLCEQVFVSLMENKDSYQRYAINLSLSVIRDESFLKWLLEQIMHLGNEASRLNIEVNENIVMGNIDIMRNFLNQLHKYNIQVGVDHCSCGFNSFAYLDLLDFDYVKLDGSFSLGIDNKVTNQGIVKSFITVAHARGILVFATCVETSAEKEILNRLKVDGMQGFAIGQPI